MTPVDASIRNLIIAASAAAVLMSFEGAFFFGAVLNFFAWFAMSALFRKRKEELQCRS